MSELTSNSISEEEFWDLFVRSQRNLERFAASLIRDESLREDVVAETSLSVLRAIRAGGGPTRAAFISYMRVAVRHEALKVLAVENRLVATPDIDQIAEESQDPVLPDDDGIAAARAVRRAFLQLSERSQTILYLVEVEGMRLAEVAQRLGLSERSVGSAVHRARDLLRTRYLQELVADNLTCSEMRDDYLAAYARGRSTALRRRRIEQHCEGCPRCQTLLHAMLAARVPVAVLLGLVFVGDLAGMAGTSAVGGSASVLAGSAPVSTPLGGAGLRATLLKIGVPSVGLVVAAGVILFPLLQPALVAPTVSGSGSAVEVSARVPAEENAADTPPEADTTASVSAVPDRLATSTPSSSGVVSVEWREVPPEYWAGGSGIQLLLTVTVEGEGSPGDYEVTVTMPDGVAVSAVSAGCVVTNRVSVCTPTLNMARLQAYNLQFVVDIAADAPLPVATVRTT
ncbi:hypothetical protein GCM10022198_01460 [Klugiella xanthotipulae]|uniref:RNA polymerase sigma factor (Sigma-70 family) n=1 Tax=Klugiella xanthotipulae TaxID=244735 RepID=A0A543I562_9MICO|nr:sigma-70 family RNA polymerase sigma factor [Klugiella xanthotipulae]TQM65717.1 RNA polymerase sigma factor (sigma-70 family) [Klugiella xanthotipulae]